MRPEDESLLEEARAAAAEVADLEALRQRRAGYLGKKGEVKQRLKGLKDLDPDARRERGRELHELKDAIESAFAEAEARLRAEERERRLAAERIDVTLPGRRPVAGSLHPIEATTRIVVAALAQLGFAVAEGPEVEDEHHNFDALNFPPDHPAKEMQDTFFLADEHRSAAGAPLLLRTHTSPVQIRAMEDREPPLRIAAPGKVYRCDADITHSPMFHQVEGFWVDERVTFRDLKGVLTELIRAVFGAELAVRFRPSFFPFTEPSAEVDMGCVHCGGEGCRICSGSGWIEVLGSGMIHPNVLRAVDIDPGRWQGFAFGLGVERFAMIRYGIPDIRLFYESDWSFLTTLGEPALLP